MTKYEVTTRVCCYEQVHVFWANSRKEARADFLYAFQGSSQTHDFKIKKAKDQW